MLDTEQINLLLVYVVESDPVCGIALPSVTPPSVTQAGRARVSELELELAAVAKQGQAAELEVKAGGG
jgi:hypothetical protein